MTTQTIEKGEDLIILGDETSNDNSILDFNDGEEKIENVSQSDEFVINFDVSEEKKVETDFILDNEINLIEEKTNESDLFNFNFDDINNDDINNIDEVKLIKTDSVEEIIDFGLNENNVNDSVELVEDNTIQNIVESKKDLDNFGLNENNSLSEDLLDNNENEKIEKNTTFDRNSILDEAISKMQSRKGNIGEIKTLKEKEVSDLNKKISELKHEVIDLEKNIKNLEEEESSLDLDISSIEKIKSSTLEVSSDNRSRKHNLNTIKKK